MIERRRVEGRARRRRASLNDARANLSQEALQLVLRARLGRQAQNYIAVALGRSAHLAEPNLGSIQIRIRPSGPGGGDAWAGVITIEIVDLNGPMGLAVPDMPARGAWRPWRARAIYPAGAGLFWTLLLRRRCRSRGRRGRRSRRVVMMMPVPVVVMPMVVMLDRFGGRRRRPFRGAGYSGLCEGIISETERKRGGRHKGLNHGAVFLWLRRSPAVSRIRRDS